MSTSSIQLRYLHAAGLTKLIPKSNWQFKDLSKDDVAKSTKEIYLDPDLVTADEVTKLKKACYDGYKRREAGASTQYSFLGKLERQLKAKDSNERTDDILDHIVADLEELPEKLREVVWAASPRRGWVYRERHGQLSAFLLVEARYYLGRRYGDDDPCVSLEFATRNDYGMLAETFSLHFNDTDMTVRQILERLGVTLESEELHAAHVDAAEIRTKLASKLGQLCTAKDGARGHKLNDGAGRDSRDWWWRSDSKNIDLTRASGSERVGHRLVVDDTDEEREDKRGTIESTAAKAKKFWLDKLHSIPVSTTVRFFDLDMDAYVDTSATNVDERAPDTAIKDKLVLPDSHIKILDILTDSADVELRDIVAGKTGGVIVLCSGAPGLGKTLSAEVYALHEGRPLYSVQCSQLGLDPEELEKNLGKVLTRAARWNAVLLLDEVDVYVRERGDDIMQNALVGVFLRLLEYYPGLLFMTTNRPDSIDDAVLSRCVAHVAYQLPTDDMLTRLWKVLATQLTVNLTDAEITQLCADFGPISGRAIKNLLRLAKFAAVKQKKRPGIELIHHVAEYIDDAKAARAAKTF